MKTKSVAIPSSLSAALGITEPAIFGVNLRFTKPLVCGMAGGAAGSLLASIFHIGATSYGVTGLPGFLITLDYTVQYAVVLAVSAGVAFALTWVLWKEESEESEKSEEKQETKQPEKTKTQDSAGQTLAEGVLFAPVTGNVIRREEIPDETFASGVLGDGVGIEPEIGEVVAPFDGEISSVTDTCHAVGITGPFEMEVLIHVGVDTVNMKGDGFHLLVKEGEKVKAGQKLLAFDLDKIKAAGYSTTTAVLLTNSDDFSAYKIVKTGKTNKMEKLLTVEQ
jgi:PTS system sucrose-specific IIC component